MLDKERQVARQNGRILHTKIYILNFSMQKVAEISGIVLDGATFTNDATSDIRRTCSISLIPQDNNILLSYANNMQNWIDKYIQIFIGIEDNNSEITYTNMGIYIVENPSKTYDAQTNTLTINGIDMMAKLTGLRNGYLEGMEYQIPAFQKDSNGNLIHDANGNEVPSKIRDAMLRSIQLSGIKKYVIESPSPTPTVPNDINISVGGTVYDLVIALRDINANYQAYFDVNGTFRFNQIPSGHNEPIMVNDETWKDVLISYNTSIDFDSVKNYIEVYGKTDDKGETPVGIAYDNNPQSPFYYKGHAGTIRIVLNGGEYDNIQGQTEAPSIKQYPYTTMQERMNEPHWRAYDILAQQRADYELYLRCKLQDCVTITCVPLYWLDVNWLVEITLPNKDGVEETNQYIIKSINTTLSTQGTQEIKLMRYYPLYENFDT